ncbi:hypothetical protein Trydic_g13870 [Trypoxylus dichotomus]
MANSRLEKIGTIYTRTKGLIDSGALKWIDRPLWYDLYEAFPPRLEPRFDRPAPKRPIRNIFYEDDKIRALFHRNNKRVGTVNLSNDKTPSLTQRFIDIYKKLDTQYESQASEEKLYKEAIEMMSRDRESKKEDEFVSLSSAFKEAQSKNTETSSIDIKKLFKS